MEKKAMWDEVECIAQFKINGISLSLSADYRGNKIDTIIIIIMNT
jgi:hypothetical protein